MLTISRSAQPASLRWINMCVWRRLDPDVRRHRLSPARRHFLS